MKTFAALILAATFIQADIPMTLVSEDEAEPIHSAIIRKEAWTQDPVRRLRADADRRMKEGPWSVTTDRPKGVDLDPHEYYSEAPYYWPNPDNPSGPYLRDDGHTMIRRLGLDHNHAVNRDLRPIVQHNVHDLRIDEYVADQLVAQQINHQAHECISAG